MSGCPLISADRVWHDEAKSKKKNHRFTLSQMKAHMSGCPLITATDGNHGYGVAWLASKLPSPCHVLMPKGSAEARVERTRKLGAHGEVSLFLGIGLDRLQSPLKWQEIPTICLPRLSDPSG